MAVCAPLLDEELSSFVFSYLTESSGSQEWAASLSGLRDHWIHYTCAEYEEEEVCSDRLDFPDIDLSQLDTSDFDSVSCLSELPWCSEQAADASPASIHCSTADELFEIEENAALLSVLTDSLDWMVDAEVGGFSVFPSLEDESCPEDEDEDAQRLSSEDLSSSLGAETENPSLLMQLLLTPPNMPAGAEAHKDGVHGRRYGNRNLHLRPFRPLAKSDLPPERKPRAVRPSGRLCTELHRHLTTAQDTEDTPTPDTEDDEEDEDSDSEEDEEEDEEEESSSSEVEGVAPVVSEPVKPQFSSEKELRSVVELITYMHTYCLPTRKQQQSWERRDRDLPKPRVRPEAARPAATPTSHSRVVLVASPGTSGTLGGQTHRRLPFARRREMKANSLLRELLLQQSSSYDVSKPYRLHSPPYCHAPSRAAAPPSASCIVHKVQKDTSSPERLSSTSSSSSNAPLPTQSLEDAVDSGGSFSVRRSRRLASFPSRFAKRLRPARPKDDEGTDKEAREDGSMSLKLLPTHAGGGTTTETQAEQLPSKTESSNTSEPRKPCCHEKRACLCLPLVQKANGESQYSSSKPFEPTLSVDLCGTAGLTPPTTPPHKPVEDELFKPTDGGKGGGEANIGVSAKATPWLGRAQHQRKLPEQTELYAQLQRMGQSPSDTQRCFGDHDYCVPSPGDSRKRNAAILGAMLQAQGVGEPASVATAPQHNRESEENEEKQDVVEPEAVMSPSPLTERHPVAATPPTSEEEEAEQSSASRSPSPSPIHHLCPDSPSSKTDSSENSEICPDEVLRNNVQSDEDNCQVFYIHNLPTSVTQNMLRKRFQVFGNAEDCKVIICNEERCGVIKIRQPGGQRHRRERDAVLQTGPAGLRRLSRKRYIDLDEAGPGPVKSKYDALDFDTLLKEAQKSLHR